MKIWTTDNTSGLQDAGAFRRVGAPVPDQGDVLVEVTDAVALAVDASAWYVPPGHSANIELLQALKEDGRLIYVTANGLGRNSIASLRQLMQGARWVLTYHDVGADDVAYFQQLAWLRAQPEPSAVVSADLHRLMVASFIEPDALIYTGSGVPLNDLLRVLGTFVRRPLSPPEVDMLEEERSELERAPAVHCRYDAAPGGFGGGGDATAGTFPDAARSRDRLRVALSCCTGGAANLRASLQRDQGMMAHARELSVVIRTKNEEQWLDACLFAVSHQDVDVPEIVLVDNDSTDGTVAIAKKYGCRILRIPDGEFNFSRALNTGIAATSSPFIAILSGHCVPVDEQWLSRLLMHFDNDEVAAVYGRQEPLPDSSPLDKRDLWITFGLERKVQRKDYFFHNANSMIRRATWEQTPFNENINGVEDQDWAKKVLRNGNCIVYEPTARVYHHHGIHHSSSEERAERVVRMIELIQQDKA